MGEQLWILAAEHMSGVRKNGERIEAFHLQILNFHQTQHLTGVTVPHLLVLSPAKVVEHFVHASSSKNKRTS